MMRYSWTSGSHLGHDCCHKATVWFRETPDAKPEVVAECLTEHIATVIVHALNAVDPRP